MTDEKKPPQPDPANVNVPDEEREGGPVPQDPHEDHGGGSDATGPDELKGTGPSGGGERGTSEH